MRRGYTKGLRYTIDLSKIADRENPRTVEAPIPSQYQEAIIIDWGDGTSETFNSEINPAHTYAGTGNVFTITIRSATGHLPRIVMNRTPALNITKAIISIDHFAGFAGDGVFRDYAGHASETTNLKYIDTRLPGQWNWRSLETAYIRSGISQDIQSFCFDFLTSCTNFAQAFAYCSDLKGSLAGNAFDNCVSVKSFRLTFRECPGITAPYIFWKSDGTLDTDKLPSLTDGTWCYYGCSSMDLSQIPSTYGGTMTVS